MAKSARKSSSSDPRRAIDTVDKLAKAAMSKEMLAAGLAAAAAAISASPKARRAIRDAGLDAADTASQAATNMMSSATKLGSIIAEAVADAAQRVMSRQMERRRWFAAARELVARRVAQVDRAKRATRQALDGKALDGEARETSTRAKAASVRARKPLRRAAKPAAKRSHREALARVLAAAHRARGESAAQGAGPPPYRRNGGSGERRRERLSRAILELEAREPRIEPAARIERCVRAFLDDPAVVHDDDPVGGAHRREAVRDDDRRAIAPSAGRARPGPAARFRRRAPRSLRRAAARARRAAARGRWRCAGAGRPTGARRLRP